MDLKRGIEKAVDPYVGTQEDVEAGDRYMVAQVVTISANNDETIGNIIAEAMDKVGKDASSPSKSPHARHLARSRQAAIRPRYLAPTSSPTPSAWKSWLREPGPS